MNNNEKIARRGDVSRLDKAINQVFIAAYILTNFAGAWGNQTDLLNPVILRFT